MKCRDTEGVIGRGVWRRGQAGPDRPEMDFGRSAFPRCGISIGILCLQFFWALLIDRTAGLYHRFLENDRLEKTGPQTIHLLSASSRKLPKSFSNKSVDGNSYPQS